ncbi:Os03g0577150 [Oryza sativa Japonica Group]|uniref:Os03g0577150 protein n=1 Tax=Oryza sativa subsp. japonica TaxID=39947 RepID=A0A0P0VZI4_ORYSJ|nr:hypothetical protein EE612_018585 [Oryza sativa]BAS85036.1 Os03g0577150 [Oryza sativa Japonica Group]
MGLLLEADNLLKMGVIYVGINTKQALENCLYNLLEVWREWCACFWGNIDSSSSWPSIQSIRYSTYFGADTSIGFFICTPSAHLYSYLHKFHQSLLGSSQVCRTQRVCRTAG